MNPQDQSKLDRIKASLRREIELGEQATAGPWVAHHGWADPEMDNEATLRDYPDWCEITGAKASINGHFGIADATFIAHTRTIGPAAAQVALTGIEALEGMICDSLNEHLCDNDGRGCPACFAAESALSAIIAALAGGGMRSKVTDEASRKRMTKKKQSSHAVVSCEWFTQCGPTRGRRTKLLTCGKPAQWKCGGKRREHYYCTEHRNEFIEAVYDRERELARWTRADTHT